MSFNVLNNKNNSLRPIYLINNINNYTSSTIVNNRKGSLDKNFYSSKKGKAFNMNNSLRLHLQKHQLFLDQNRDETCSFCSSYGYAKQFVHHISTIINTLSSFIKFYNSALKIKKY